MATKKYLTKYARGGNIQNTRLNDGLRAMQIQSQTQTSALKDLRNEAAKQAAQYSTGLDRAARVAEANRKLKREVEVETPEKLKLEALKRNNLTNQKSAATKKAEYDKLAGVWQRLSPTLAKNFQALAQKTTDYYQTQAGIEEYNKLVEEGKVGSISALYKKTESQVDFLKHSQNRFKEASAAAKGDLAAKQRFDYLTNTFEINNPITKKLFFQDYVKNFDGFERDFIKFAEQQGIPVNKKTVMSLYQFRAMEVMKQFNINPKSELGFKIQKLHRQKGFTAENQLTLGEDYERNTQVINGFSKRIKALSHDDAAQFSRADFDTDAEYESVKKAFYDRKNALFVDVISSVNARPVQNKDGSYSPPVIPNTRANIVGWAKSEMDNYNDFQTFLEHVMGVTPDNPDGYLIPGAEKDTPKNHILAKFPYLKQELTEDFGERFTKKIKTQETITKARQQNEALKYQKRMNDGYYKENPDAFFADWESTNGNKYARELFAGSLGFKSQYINAETLSSTIVQAYKSGDMRLVYHAWAALPDEQQKIGFIYEDLNGLAQAQGVQFEDLDDHIKKLTNATIEEVEKDGVLDKSSGPSAATMSEYMRSELLARYGADRNGTPTERFARAKESIDKQLGYVNGVLVNFDKDGYRGSGLFKQKQGKSGASNKVIFTRFAGENFGNISSFEIDATLGDTKGQTRVNGLVDLVAEDMASNKPTINNTHLYNLLKTGKTNNALLNKLMDESVLQSVQKEDFVNTLKNTVDADAKTKKAVMQWGADKWCDEILGARAAGMSNDQKALQVCVNAIEAQFDMPAWEFLLNAKNREQLQN